MKNILIFPGDGIGPEVVRSAREVINACIDKFSLDITCDEQLVGGASIDAHDVPLTEEALSKAKLADAVLLGAVGGPKWDDLPIDKRPEQALLKLRKSLNLFANLRPIKIYPELIASSSLKKEIIKDTDLLIVRELTGGLYYGKPRGIRVLDNGEQEGYNTYVYRESEIKRISALAFEIAALRKKRLCSIDKANVLEVTRLWRQVVSNLADQYKDIKLQHMYIDNAAMQLILNPSQFDVLLTGNMFGDILSDCAATITGSIGLLPSASINEHKKGMYEPIHGSAPDIAGEDKANPLGTILSVALMFRISLFNSEIADDIEKAVEKVIASGYRTNDIFYDGCKLVSTTLMTKQVIKNLLEL